MCVLVRVCVCVCVCACMRIFECRQEEEGRGEILNTA